MTTKPPSGLAASGTANDPDPEQITREQNEDGQDINVDPSEDVTVEATEDVTSEASSHTPPPQPRPGTVGVSPGQRAPTLLGVPIASLPLPGVTSASENEDATRTIDYNEEVTVLAQPAPNDPMSVLDALDRPSFTDDLDRPSITDDDEEETKDARPSITDDDEEETKVEPADAAMKAAASIDDVSTALSAQASVEREKALRRSAPSLKDDLEFADPEAEDDEDENVDDELDDEGEILSAGGAIEEEEDDVGEASDGVATATFMKPADTTGLSGLLSPRRPPTGGRDGFGSRLPTPYPPPQSPIPGPSTSPFASRLGPAPVGSPYGGRATGAAMPAIQVPPPSGKATMDTGPGFFSKQVPMGIVWVIAGGSLVFGFGIRGFFGGKSAPAHAVVAAKPVAVPPPPAALVVEPVQTGQPAAHPEPKPGDTTAVAKPATPPGTEPPAGAEPAGDNPEAGMWRPAKKPIATAKPHKPPVDMAVDEGDGVGTKPKPAIAKEQKVPGTPPAATATKPVGAKEPKPAVTATAKPAKKPAKPWVDPFAN